VVLARAKRSVEFPARFQLVAAMNPCPCGYAGDPRGRCRCTKDQVARYHGRVSGPLIDRIDMHVALRALPVDDLIGDDRPSVHAPLAVESSAMVAVRVAAARQRQLERQGKLNARLAPTEVIRLCPLGRESRVVAATAIERLGLSARGFHRVLKLARTCADLAGAPGIRLQDVSEAMQLRALDRITC
jgi:magnesium chelatase family protein